MNRSYPEGKRLLLCASTERAALAVSKMGIRQTKDAEKRDKESVRAGKSSRAGKPRQPSKTPAMPKTAPMACERKAT